MLTSRHVLPALALAAAAALSACAPTTDADRALIGAGVGALAADLSDKSVILGAVGGAAAGAVCDDVGICRNRGPYYARPTGQATYPVIVDGRTVYVERVR